MNRVKKDDAVSALKIEWVSFTKKKKERVTEWVGERKIQQVV